MYNSPELLRIRLRLLLKSRGMQVQELAKKSGLYGSQISVYLAGKKVPSLSVLDKLCEALDVTPGQLLEHDPERAALHFSHMIFLLKQCNTTELSAVAAMLEGFSIARQRKKEQEESDERFK